MKDDDCVAFLQWALPRLHLRWPGFRKVRGQVCKRLARRMQALGLSSPDGYRHHLEADPTEWEILDGLCRITISRFFRDRGVWGRLGDHVLPELAVQARARGAPLRCWSAGCASGEEPYSLSLLWHLGLAARFPEVRLEILATDADAHMLRRAERACYPPASLRELPEGWVERAFARSGSEMCLLEPFRAGVQLLQGDLRASMPDGPFHLVFCRNLAFTYFDPGIQRRVLAGLAGRLVAGGRLVLGSHEALPEGAVGFTREDQGTPILRRSEPSR